MIIIESFFYGSVDGISILGILESRQNTFEKKYKKIKTKYQNNLNIRND